jgi:hypothetical protein
MSLLKRLFILFIVLLGQHAALAGNGGELVLAGVYHGTNLYVQNPHTPGGDYCISKILINDKPVEKVPQSTAFEIDLSHLKINDNVVVKIYHSSDCGPKVINPSAIRVKEEFQFASVEVTDEFVQWVSTGEKNYGKYFIEKFANNSWVVDKVVSSKSKPGSNFYSQEIAHHSGINKYRVKYLEISGKSYFSTIVEYESQAEKVTFFPKRVTNKITFSREVDYEILNVYGNSVTKGSGNIVNCSRLKTGTYYLNFDNRTEKFFKK